jgi:antitoxin PrlF
MLITSKITSKAQTTIPQPVRIALGLREGDEVAYQIEGDRAVLTKARATQIVEDPFGAFGEWSSDADRKGYADF